LDFSSFSIQPRRLHLYGVTDIQTATQAAEALRPVAGEFAFLLFVVGIVGTGLLAIPVLAGSVAYALAELRRWPAGLAKSIRSAARILRHHRCRHLAWGRPRPRVCQSNQGSVLECSDKRSVGGSHYDPGHADGLESQTDAKLKLPAPQRVVGWIATVAMLGIAVGKLVTTVRR
jgi:hypothetical protein